MSRSAPLPSSSPELTAQPNKIVVTILRESVEMRADRPITRVDFVNLQPELVPDAPAPQPDTH